MGATARTDLETGEHVSTGKLGHVDERHAPQWSPWQGYDHGFSVRYCTAAGWCDAEDIKPPPD